MSAKKEKIDEEVYSLLELAHEKSGSGRLGLFQGITDILERRHRELSEKELSLMSKILGNLIQDIEMGIRKKLAERLASKEDAPLDLILLLANDNIEVAEPVLMLSKIISDQNLINIIRHKSAQHQMGICARKNLSAPVCQELVSHGNSDVLVALLINKDARIANDTIAELVEKSRFDKDIQPALIERPDLPKGLASNMYKWVSDALKETILTTHSLTQNDIENILSSSINDLKVEDENQSSKEKSEERLVEKLQAAGRLKASFLMKSLHQGQSSLFEISFAKMLNIPRNIMCSVLYDRGPDSLAIACRAVNIDQSIFLTIFRLTRKARDMDAEISKEETSRAFEFFKDMDQRRAQLTIHKWVEDAARNPIF